MHSTAGAACCGACNDHAAVVLTLFGTGAAAVDDQTDDVDDRADACSPPMWAALFYGSADAALVSSCKPRWTRRRPRPRPATPAQRLRNLPSKFKFDLCHSPQLSLGRPAGSLTSNKHHRGSHCW